MRPGQTNKRMRGRPGSRKGPNPLTRSYESSGPDVKIRGTAQHIGEKYLQLARDAQASGDPVMAESYLQHAEHYFRLIAAAQQMQSQGAGPYQGQAADIPNDEFEDDLAFGGMADRFASPTERQTPLQPGTLPLQPSPAQPSAERPFYGNHEKQAYRPERGPRPERSFSERPYRERDQQGGAERPYSERPYLERNGRGRDQDTSGSQGRGPRDYRGEPAFRAEQRPEPQMADAGLEAAALPAFITAPARVPAEPSEPASPIEMQQGLRTGPAAGEAGAGGFHPRPRRRRLPRAEAEANQPIGADGGANDRLPD